MELKNLFYLSLGSNLGDSIQYLQGGINALADQNCSIHQCSSVYESEALGMDNAPNFFNCCVKGTTDLSAYQLIKLLHEVEDSFGRTRKDNELLSRTLDIDLVFFNSDVIDESFLKVPHPRYHLRKFVLLPLLEIDYQLTDPRNDAPLTDLLINCQDNSTIRKLPNDLILRE